MLPHFPAYHFMCNGRLRLITWDRSNARIPQLLFLAEICNPLQLERVECRAHSFLGSYMTHCPFARRWGEEKSKGHELWKPLSFWEKAEQLLLLHFFPQDRWQKTRSLNWKSSYLGAVRPAELLGKMAKWKQRMAEQEGKSGLSRLGKIINLNWVKN